MHKSIILLLGLLAFLLPIGTSSMSHSNAMAFEEYGYEEADQYERYATDMANDNYYKSQGSDIIKKIKCNNINSNLNGIDANIDTGDSLGLGAESLEADDASANWFGNGERNNGNFDLDCINNNNNEGGQGGGATGPQGPEGPPGPSGITQLIDGTNVYLVTNSTTAPGGQSLDVTALCEPGDFVLNGGYTYSGSLAGPNMFVAINEPLTNPSGGGWRTGIFATGGTLDNTLTVHAYCFDNSPSSTLTVASTISQIQQQSEDSPIISQGIADSPIMSQGIKNSPKLTALEKQPDDSSELTALEKTTKLKTQWLELLP